MSSTRPGVEISETRNARLGLPAMTTWPLLMEVNINVSRIVELFIVCMQPTVQPKGFMIFIPLVISFMYRCYNKYFTIN